MKILICGSVALPVPPPAQGGTERIAYWQAKGLFARGHEVTLIAAQGSLRNEGYALVEIGGGDTAAGSARAQKTTQIVESSRNLRKESVYLAQVAQYILDDGARYDVILNNMRAGESSFLPVAKAVGKPIATVMHLPLFPELAKLFQEYRVPVITISNAQRTDYPDLRYAGTVYNGIDIREFPDPRGQAGEYLLMMGSIAPHKNQKEGILAAKALGLPIMLAGKISNQAYYDQEIAPHVDGRMVVHKGELALTEKVDLYAHAKALLFPVLWDEPFGLVMIEAMACGTPVVAYRRGAIPEVIVDGKTGYIVDSPEAMIAAVRNIGEIDRAACRKHVEEHFTTEKMIDALEAALKNI